MEEIMVEQKSKFKSAPQPSDSDGSDSFNSYIEYNKILRTWFVAYGIGGPALFLVNEKVAEKLAKTGSLKVVVTSFLVGILMQVIGALLNKVANWYVYGSTLDPTLLNKTKYLIAEWFIDQFWIDITIDVITILSFGIAAWYMLTVFS